MMNLMHIHMNPMKTNWIAISCLAALLGSCTTIPSRPLSPEEQSLVGIWMTNQRVDRVGKVQAAQQVLPNRQSRLMAHVMGRGPVNASSRWEAVNGRLHETGFLGRDDWSTYQLTNGGNTLILDGINGRITWERYSHNPHHPLQDAYAAAEGAGAPGAGSPGMLDFMLLDMKNDLKRNEALAAAGDEKAQEYVRIFKPQIEYHERTKLENMRNFQASRRRYPID